MDVPAEETSSPQGLAQPFAQPLPHHQSVENTVNFCATCLKNQHLLTETLSNYLPSAEDPNYDRYEASYPEYRRKLEERYPPVCTRCEPAVRRQIQQAGYAAKSDHLRRMVERSRRRRIASRTGWRSIVVTLGGLFFWTSITGQLVWNLIGVRENPMRITSESENSMGLRPLQCAVQLATGLTDRGCAVAFAPVAQIAIILGFLSIWWNPKWHHKLQGREGRLVGLRDYYVVNVVTLLLRFGFWTLARNLFMTGPTFHNGKVTHGFAMVVTLVFTVYAMTRIEIDTTPLVSWQDNPVQLLSQQQYNPPARAESLQPTLSSTDTLTATQNFQEFPISSLAPEPQRKIWQAPTPPPDEDPDAMEWEPSQNFQPNPRLPKAKAPSGPSPFHGALPAKPTNRLLHPQPERQTPQKEAIGLPPGFFDKRNHLARQKDSSQLPPMAQPKFFSQRDRDADTGLEGIFNAVFSLGDTPTVQVQQAGPQNPSKKQRQVQNVIDFEPSSPGKPWYRSLQISRLHTAKLIVFVTGWFVLYAALEHQLNVPHAHVFMVCIAGLVQLCSALSELLQLNQMSDFSDTVWSASMAGVSIVLMLQGRSRGNEEAVQKDVRLVMVLLFVYSCWELPRLWHWDLPKLAKTKVGPAVQVNAFMESQIGSLPATDFVDGRPYTPAAAEEPLRPVSANVISSMFHDPFRQTEQPKYGTPLQPSQRRPHQFRRDSTDSTASESSIATTATATTAGWMTPNFREQNLEGISGPSPGFNLRGLALNEAAASPRRQKQNGLGSRSRRRF